MSDMKGLILIRLKRSGTFWYDFIAVMIALEFKVDLESLYYWLSEKLDCVSEVSSLMLLDFLFTFLL